MGMKKIRIAAIALLALVMTTGLPLASAFAEKGELKSLDIKGEPIVNIMLGKAEMLSMEGDVSDILVANPSIVDVMAVKSNQLYLVGSALGDTNIMVLDGEGNVMRRVNIHVQMDTDKLERIIAELYPEEHVKISALTDQLILTGNVSTPAVAASITNLAGEYAGEIQNLTLPVDQIVTNMMTVSGEQQVMLKVKIVEASRAALKDLGLETRFGDGSNSIGAVGVAGGAIASGLGLTAPAQLGVLALNYSSGSFGPMSFLARALEQEGIVNTLAEPNLTAISGEQAGFLAGGEVPIPTEIDRNGNLVYEFRPFGVSLNFRPTVMSANRISMELTTEVSSASYDENLQLQGVTVPTFNVRRADTTVELPSGGTLMIAGLLKSDTASNLSSIPGVNKVPVVGDLLKSDSFQRNESELVVIITPYLVKPFAVNAAAPEPLKTSGDMKDIPRLSISDLGAIPGEETQIARAPETNRSADDMATKNANKSMASKSGRMAPPAGLSEQAMMADVPAAPVRDENKLNSAFEKNIKRNFSSKKVDTVMKNVGSFGYMTD